MITYQNSQDISAMLTEYTEIMTRYGEYMEKVNAYQPEEMSTADAAYLMEVSARVSKKMIEVTE